jgi:hypothetical protein
MTKLMSAKANATATSAVASRLSIFMPPERWMGALADPGSPMAAAEEQNVEVIQMISELEPYKSGGSPRAKRENLKKKKGELLCEIKNRVRENTGLLLRPAQN